jgi:hypothetical protein
LYEITFTEQAKDMHMLGRKQPYFYELRLEKFKYSQEFINTGNEEIDHIVNDSAYQIVLHTNAGNGGNYQVHEIVYQSADSTQANATAVALVQEWASGNNQITVSNIAGTFADNVVIIGASSNARHTLITYDPLLDHSFNETYSNKLLQTESNEIIDFSETNPFGNI